jgi:hypothetical protein
MKPNDFIHVTESKAYFVRLGLLVSPNCDDQTAANLNIISIFDSCNGRSSCPITEKFIKDNELFVGSKYASRLDTNKIFTTPLKIIISYTCVSKWNFF